MDNLDNLDKIKQNLERIIILLETEGFSEDTAVMMLNTLKLTETLDINHLKTEDAIWLNSKIQSIDTCIQEIKEDIVVKLKDKEKELNLIEDISRNLQEIT